MACSVCGNVGHNKRTCSFAKKASKYVVYRGQNFVCRSKMFPNLSLKKTSFERQLMNDPVAQKNIKQAIALRWAKQTK